MSLKQSAFSAGRWTTASTAIVSGTQILQTVLLARILVPADFGSMAVVASVLAALSLVADFGLSQALIYHDDVSQDSYSSMYWLNAALSAAMMICLIAVAPYFGTAYASPQLASMLRWASLVFPLTSLGQQLRVRAAKNLRFAALAGLEIPSAAVGTASAVSAALTGLGPYSLVIGVLASAATSSLLAWWRVPIEYRPTLHFEIRGIVSYFRFGSFVVGENLVNALAREADVLAGSLAVGATNMGTYAVPRNLALRLSQAVNSVVSRVGFPVMSLARADRDKLKSIYLQALRMTASVNFPIYVGLGLFANEIIALLYGASWKEAAVYLRLLSAWGLVRSTANPVGSLLLAVGQVRRAFLWSVFYIVTFPPLLWLAANRYGALGLSECVLVVQIVLVLPVWWILVRPCCSAGLVEYLSQFAGPLLISALTGAVAWSATRAVPHGTLRMAVAGVVGGAMYVSLSWVFNRSWCNAMLELMKARKQNG